MEKIQQLRKNSYRLLPLLSGRVRLSIWEGVRGIWKDKKINPISNLDKIRKEWDRNLPSL